MGTRKGIAGVEPLLTLRSRSDSPKLSVIRFTFSIWSRSDLACRQGCGLPLGENNLIRRPHGK